MLLERFSRTAAQNVSIQRNKLVIFLSLSCEIFLDRTNSIMALGLRMVCRWWQVWHLNRSALAVFSSSGVPPRLAACQENAVVPDKCYERSKKTLSLDNSREREILDGIAETWWMSEIFQIDFHHNWFRTRVKCKNWEHFNPLFIRKWIDRAFPPWVSRCFPRGVLFSRNASLETSRARNARMTERMLITSMRWQSIRIVWLFYIIPNPSLPFSFQGTPPSLTYKSPKSEHDKKIQTTSVWRQCLTIFLAHCFRLVRKETPLNEYKKKLMEYEA